MGMKGLNSHQAPLAVGGYSQALLLEHTKRLVFVSGQIPVDRAGRVPETFAEQCRLVWSNILAQLAEAGMEAGHIAKVTTFLSDRKDADENGAIRREVLGAHAPALSVVLAGIFDPAWLLEIEVIAAEGDA